MGSVLISILVFDATGEPIWCGVLCSELACWFCKVSGQIFVRMNFLDDEIRVGLVGSPIPFLSVKIRFVLPFKLYCLHRRLLLKNGMHSRSYYAQAIVSSIKVNGIGFGTGHTRCLGGVVCGAFRIQQVCSGLWVSLCPVRVEGCLRGEGVSPHWFYLISLPQSITCTAKRNTPASEKLRCP